MLKKTKNILNASTVNWWSQITDHQHCPIKHSVMMEMFNIHGIQNGNPYWNVTSINEELIFFKFYWILIHLNLNNHVWLMATILDSKIETTFGTESLMALPVYFIQNKTW